MRSTSSGTIACLSRWKPSSMRRMKHNWRLAVDEDTITAEASAYSAAVNYPLLLDVMNEVIIPTAAPVQIVTDTPDKLTQSKNNTEYLALATELSRQAEVASEEIIIISPYFVPGKQGAALIASHTRRGVRMVVLTNSLASTNHIAVNSGYARYRKQLLEAGVELYEVKADFVVDQEIGIAPN